MKIMLKLLTISFGALLLVAPQTQAVPVTDSFDVDVIFGPGAGFIGGTIEVSYDDALITGTGVEGLSQPDFSLVLDLFGQIFDETDDVDFPFGTFPTLDFFDGEITFINFVISENPINANPVAIDDPTIVFIAGGDVVGGITAPAVWEVDTSEFLFFDIPEPATALLLGFGLIGMGLRRRRKLQ